ncbi:MAG TPA: dihydrodipicolinate synthase family protein [Devosiaceae bacterium]|nr:dihydrodipicolinate synthase family protein [Devosiaceae bacterium]
MPALSADQRHAITGILPPLTSPFSKEGRLDASGFAEQVNFIMDAGARGIVIGGSTGEGHTLDRQEFETSMRASSDALKGRGGLLAGLIVNSTQEAIDRVKMLDGLKVDALQVTPVHYLFKPGAQATIDHFKAISENTDIPILIYNVIQWNYLSVDLMLRIMDEVPGVVGMKQSNGDLKSVSDLLMRLKPDNIIISGIDAMLYPAFLLGAHGAITALTAAVPRAVVKLWDAVQTQDYELAKDLHFKLGALYNSFTHDNLPACTKYAQHRQGIAMYYPKSPMEHVSDEQKARIDRALAHLI